jgi:hypothetical protein
VQGVWQDEATLQSAPIHDINRSWESPSIHARTNEQVSEHFSCKKCSLIWEITLWRCDDEMKPCKNEGM